MKAVESASVLMVACNGADAQLISRTLAASHEAGEPSAQVRTTVRDVKKVSGAVRRLQRDSIQAIIFDMQGPPARDLADFERLLAAARRIPILVLCDAATEPLARQAVERGAKDYVLKNDLQEFRIRRAVLALIAQQIAEESAHLQKQCAEAALSCTGDALLVCDNARPRHPSQRLGGVVDRLVSRRGSRPRRQ